jgi:hypothetical protein
VPLEDLEKLTEIPILIIYADFLENRQSSLDGLANARAFVKALNSHGGHAEIIHLPEVGIEGNSHIMMLEENNVEIAGLVSRFLRENGLAKRRGHGKHNDVASH